MLRRLKISVAFRAPNLPKLLPTPPVWKAYFIYRWGLGWAGAWARLCWGWGWAGAELRLALSWGLGWAQARLALGWGPVLVGAAWGTLVPVGCAKHCLGFFCSAFDGLLVFYMLKLQHNMV